MKRLLLVVVGLFGFACVTPMSVRSAEVLETGEQEVSGGLAVGGQILTEHSVFQAVPVAQVSGAYRVGVLPRTDIQLKVDSMLLTSLLDANVGLQLVDGEKLDLTATVGMGIMLAELEAYALTPNVSLIAGYKLAPDIALIGSVQASKMLLQDQIAAGAMVAVDFDVGRGYTIQPQVTTGGAVGTYGAISAKWGVGVRKQF